MQIQNRPQAGYVYLGEAARQIQIPAAFFNGHFGEDEMKKKAKRKKNQPPKVERRDQLRCPNCGVQFVPDIWNGSGNYEEECENCDANIQFHVDIEFDGVTVVEP